MGTPLHSTTPKLIITFSIGYDVTSRVMWGNWTTTLCTWFSQVHINQNRTLSDIYVTYAYGSIIWTGFASLRENSKIVHRFKWSLTKHNIVCAFSCWGWSTTSCIDAQFHWCWKQEIRLSSLNLFQSRRELYTNEIPYRCIQTWAYIFDLNYRHKTLDLRCLSGSWTPI
jgi:hypothetical protein